MNSLYSYPSLNQLCQWIWLWFVRFKGDVLPKGPFMLWCSNGVTCVSVFLLCTFSFVWIHFSLHQAGKLIQILPWVFSQTINVQKSPEQTVFFKRALFLVIQRKYILLPLFYCTIKVATIYYYAIFLITDHFVWLLKVSKYFIFLEVA